MISGLLGRGIIRNINLNGYKRTRGFPILQHDVHLILQRRPVRNLSVERERSREDVKLNEKQYMRNAQQVKNLVIDQKQKESEEKKLEYADFLVNKKILFGLKKYLWPKDDRRTRIRLVASIIILVGGKLVGLAVPWFFKVVVDNVSDISNGLLLGESTTSLYALAITVGYGASRFGSTALQELRNAIFSYISQQSSRIAALELFRHLHKMDITFHNSMQTGTLMRILDRGSKGVSQILASIVFHLIPTIIEIIFVCGLFGFTLGISYSCVVAATIIAYAIFTFNTTSWRLKFRKMMNTSDNKASSVATDSIINAQITKYYNKIDHECSMYEKHLRDYETTSVKTINSLSCLNAGQSAITSLAIAALMWMARDDICSGLLTPGDLVLANSLLFQLSIPLNFLGTTYRDTRQSLIDIQCMQKLLELKSRIVNDQSKKPLSVVKGTIKFENVTFSYSPGKNVIKNVSFEIEGGSNVAFIGASGCGKSTIIKLITLTLTPDSGNIFIDGQNINDVTYESLMDAISVVPQEVFLFDQSIKYNIAYGGKSPTNDQIHNAAKAASIHDDIITKFNDGYDKVVGERGEMLSGGERQRIQLARSFLKNSPINLFDEYTAALDPVSESKVLSASRNFLAGTSNGYKRTSVVVSHKLRSVIHCDKIFIIDGGIILDSGTHPELLDRNCLYAQLWSRQNSTDFTDALPPVGPSSNAVNFSNE